MTKQILLFIFFLLPSIAFCQFTEKDEAILRKELASRVNALRASLGLKSLAFNDTLKQAAEFHSDFMAKSDLLSHDESKKDYAQPKDRVLAFGGKNLELIGENILYSTPQKFPLNKRDIELLADEMFLSWKNSPGHYANMTDPDYEFADYGFTVQTSKQIVFATQVFGTKGFLVENQISKNAFGLTKAPDDCDQEFKSLNYILMNMGNGLEVENNEIVLYYHDINLFKTIFSNPNDGIAIDMVREDQFTCGKPNQLDLSPIYDGILLKPVYSAEMFENNTAESDYRIITKVGEIPEGYNPNDYSFSMIIIKNGKECKYLYPATISERDYDLNPIEPVVVDEPAIELQNEVVVSTQTVVYDFKTNSIKPITVPTIEKHDEKIHSVQIYSFSSVEGDSVHNLDLQNSRGTYIRNQVQSKLQVSNELITVDARENWSLMDFQLNYFSREDISKLKHDSIKKILAGTDRSLAWDSLLFCQRKAMAVINYAGTYNSELSDESAPVYNLRTAVALNNPALANKALYLMYQDFNFSPELLFETQIMTFMIIEPRTICNFSALLSDFVDLDPYAVTKYIHSWLNRSEMLNEDQRNNLVHLYSLVSHHLLDNWDVSAERLSNVIHPEKIEKLCPKKISDLLMLNLHLTYIHYYGQINDGSKISKSFYFIADYFKTRSLSQEDDVDLALFFNHWSMYHMAIDYLTAKFKSNGLSEDGLFLLSETLNYTNYSDEAGIYIDATKQAINLNQVRWCDFMNNNFQSKRNREIKRLYCEKCL